MADIDKEVFVKDDDEPDLIEVKKKGKGRPQKRPVCDLNPQAKEVTSRNSSRMNLAQSLSILITTRRGF